MKSKFAAFADALAALCRQHHVALSPSRSGASIVVADVEEGNEPVLGLEDRTGKVPAVRKTTASVPHNFVTGLAAEQFPGVHRP